MRALHLFCILVTIAISWIRCDKLELNKMKNKNKMVHNPDKELLETVHSEIALLELSERRNILREVCLS
ncbi:hypothetical protein POVWA2_027370 [Plasmodium ovale wallikeri]|uniref:Uncharacterized protein n=1 Tax=Plasmodium ovale wallikeri TaxID=864142 RepID=A0A1A8YWK3_PLAOA|nr:hypothetical protein POVWA1_027210 [Plasmodium ovale wallikeri]SBT35915.1 hypothetical protein POVWA2_027370 [Plasmodium ovale wallikeri]